MWKRTYRTANLGVWNPVAARSVSSAIGRAAPRRRRAFTMIELIVTMAIIGILVALTLPAVTRSRQAAQRVRCSSNMRQVALALLQVTETNNRFPACGNYGRNPATNSGREHFSWVVDALPWLEQSTIADEWDKDKPRSEPPNDALAQSHIPILVCPSDISVKYVPGESHGDLSYVVNGGVGYTTEYGKGVHDCPVDPSGAVLDLNANGVICPQPPNLKDDGDPADRKLFYCMGLFFNETWKWNVTQRHHRPASVLDGMSQTILLSENVRTGYDPAKPGNSWASSNPSLTSFYIGNPCPNRDCSSGIVDYSLCNSGLARINAGTHRPEGSSPYPSSFHSGGVFMGYCDGRVQFTSEAIDGAVYAALVSPQGMQLDGTPLAQPVVVSDQ